MMLTALFPKYHSHYLTSPVVDWLAGFAEWLVSAGYAHDPAHDHVRRLKQVLEAHGPVMPDAAFSAAELAIMFTCSSQQLLFRGTQRAFAHFLVRRFCQPCCDLRSSCSTRQACAEASCYV
jgi:integrase/recombinase XerD